MSENIVKVTSGLLCLIPMENKYTKTDKNMQNMQTLEYISYLWSSFFSIKHYNPKQWC